MKTIIHSSILLALASSGIAFGAETATTTPVGYETLSLTPNSFNYLGLRLHPAAVHAGALTSVGASSVTDSTADFSALDSATLYLLEIVDGSGIVSEFYGSAVSGTTINLVDNLLAAGVAQTAKYEIRPCATIASVFGASNSAGLAPGTLSPSGADIVLVPNIAGGFDTYYYDSFGGPSFTGGWKNAATTADVTPTTVGLSYLDGVLISASATSPAALVVKGSLKKEPTLVKLLADSFTYLSSQSPVLGTLATAIDPSQLDQGTLSPSGADIVLVPSGSGFNSYYYDKFGGPSFTGGWKNADTTADVDPTTVSLDPSGLLISNAGVASNLKIATPPAYSGL